MSSPHLSRQSIGAKNIMRSHLAICFEPCPCRHLMRKPAEPQASPDRLVSLMQTAAQQTRQAMAKLFTRPLEERRDAPVCSLRQRLQALGRAPVLSSTSLQSAWPQHKGSTWTGIADYLCLHCPGSCHPFRQSEMINCAFAPPETRLRPCMVLELAAPSNFQCPAAQPCALHPKPLAPPERAGAASGAGGMTTSAPGGAASASPPLAAP